MRLFLIQNLHKELKAAQQTVQTRGDEVTWCNMRQNKDSKETLSLAMMLAAVNFLEHESISPTHSLFWVNCTTVKEQNISQPLSCVSVHACEVLKQENLELSKVICVSCKRELRWFNHYNVFLFSSFWMLLYRSYQLIHSFFFYEGHRS